MHAQLQEDMDMQFANGKGRNAALWSLVIVVGLLCLLVILKYHTPPQPLEDTYKSIEQKGEVVSQLRIHLLQSVEMEKNAVMAQTDEESKGFADQSLAASAAVEQDLKLLHSLIDTAPLQDEQKLIAELDKCWSELRKLDQVILDLAVQNTNLKAATLSRDKGAEAMRRFEKALDDVLRSYSGTPNEGRVAKLACHAIVAGLKLFNLHSAHIPESSDAKMDQIETQMKAEETGASKALDELAGIVGEVSRDALAQAKAAFADFIEVTAQVVKLSRQNSNVKSLELSLGRKRNTAAQCDEILAAFQQALQNRTFRATK
jgi:hypothetical protein